MSFLDRVSVSVPFGVKPAKAQGPKRVLDMSWAARGNCVGLDPDLFFIERGEPSAETKAVCAACVVREQCLDYALEAGERFGIWGGKSERERRVLRKQRRRGDVA